MQRIDQRTRHIAPLRMALVDQPGQHRFDPRQVRQLGAHVGELECSQFGDFAAVSAVFQLQ